jgi:opacity protein-like surface antigen
VNGLGQGISIFGFRIFKIYVSNLKKGGGSPMHIRHFQCSLIFFIFITFAVNVYAADVTVTPSLGLRGEYNDNIDFSRVNKQDDYIGTVSPALSLNVATPRFTFGATAGVDVIRYNENTENDYERQNYGLNMGYQLFERMSVNVRGSYIADTTLDTELQETGIVERRVERDFYSAGGGVSFQLTEVSDLALGYTFAKTEYDLEDFEESDSHSASLAYSHAFNNRRDVFTFRPYYRNTDSDEEDLDTYGLTLGIAHTFSETLQGNISGGPRYTETEYISGRTDDDWGWTAEVNLTKTWQIASAQIGYSRDISYTAEGDTVEVDRFTLTVSKMLTSKLSSEIAGSLYFSKSTGREAEETDTRYYTVTPSLNYSFTDQISLNLAYSYSNVYDKTVTDNREGDRHIVWLALNFNFPQKW